MKAKFWLIIHNLIAHPLLITGFVWADDFHDWTMKKVEHAERQFCTNCEGPLNGEKNFCCKECAEAFNQMWTRRAGVDGKAQFFTHMGFLMCALAGYNYLFNDLPSCRYYGLAAIGFLILTEIQSLKKK